MRDLEHQIHEYTQYLDDVMPWTPLGDAIQSRPRRSPTRPVIAFAGAAAIVLAAGGLALILLSAGNGDRPVVESPTTSPVVTTAGAPTTSVAPTTTAPPATTTTIPDPFITWTRVVSPTLAGSGDGLAHSVIAVDDELYLVGRAGNAEGTSSGVIWRSGDGGTSWERIPDPQGVFSRGDTTDVTGIAYNGDVFVAVGASDELPMIWISTDGRTWELVPEDGKRAFFQGGNSLSEINTIIATDAGFVAGGEAIWASPDGRTWALVADLTEFAGHIYGLVSTDQGLVAVGQSFSWATAAVVMVSQDGSAWTRIPDSDIRSGTSVTAMYGAVAAYGGYIAVGGGANTSAPDSATSRAGMAAFDAGVWTSPTGLVWTQSPLDSRNLGGGRGQWMSSVVPYDDVLVAVGTEISTSWNDATGVVWESSDRGRTWTRIADPDEVFGDFYAGWSQTSSVIRFEDRLIAVGYIPGDAAVWIGTPAK